MDISCDLKNCVHLNNGSCKSEDMYRNCLYGMCMDFKKKNGYSIQNNSCYKKTIKDALNKAYYMYPYEVIGKPETYSPYNAGWQDAIDYVSQLLGVDID